LVYNDPVQFTADILRGWKSKAEREARDLVGKTAAHSRSRESTITRNLALKKRLRKDLLKDAKSVDWDKAQKWPYEKFEHSEFIVHSIDDTTYPDGDVEETGISGWFKLEIWDFYHNGLEFIIGSNYGVMDSEGHWSLIKYKQSFDETKYKLIEMLCLARIPFRNIVKVDLIGDEYYPQPHIYCRFADSGEPYEGFRYVLINDEYPWPMESDRQFDINTEGRK
jgi:hypothetical protein